MANLTDGKPPREEVRFLVFSASLRTGSLSTHLARLAARTIEQHGGITDLASMEDFDSDFIHKLGVVHKELNKSLVLHARLGSKGD